LTVSVLTHESVIGPGPWSKEVVGETENVGGTESVVPVGGRGVPTMGASGDPLTVLWASTPDDEKAASASTKVTIENIVKC